MEAEESGSSFVVLYDNEKNSSEHADDHNGVCDADAEIESAMCWE